MDTTAMKFANPYALQFLLLIPVMTLIVYFGIRRKLSTKSLFIKPFLFRHLAGSRLPMSDWKHFLIFLIAIVGLIIAAARPQLGFEERKIQSRGIDLIVAIDVSNSMLAEDIKPNRLTRAKAVLQEILWSTRGDRIGVVAFAGSAQVKCPLTLDYAMAKTALQTIDAGTAGTPGTDLGAAIDASIKAFETGSSGERVLVLLTDGEDHEAEVSEALKAATEKKVRVYTIGIGTSEGVPLPQTDNSYKRDKTGKIITSRLNVDVLKTIAEKTGGKTVLAGDSGNSASQTIMDDIGTLKKSEQQDQTFRIYIERYHWFLFPALILLVLEMLLIPKRNTSFRRGVKE